MKPLGLIGIVLIISGILILVFGGFSFTRKTQVAKVGPIEVTGQKTDSFPISPVAGYLCLAGGAVLLFQGSRKAA